jgi:hypothetical protein
MASLAIPLAVTVGGMFLMQLFGPKQNNQGSQLSDLNVPAVSPGNPIARPWGTMKLGGQIIWTSKLIETKHVEKQGKGGGGGSSKVTTYTYSVDCAVGICQGPVFSVKRVRANQKLIWVNPAYEGEQTQAFDAAYLSEGTRLVDNGVAAEDASVGAFFFAFNEYQLDEFTPKTIGAAKAYVAAHHLPGTSPDLSQVNRLFDRMFGDMDKDLKYETNKKRFDSIAIYRGTGRQLPDPTIESYKGVGNVPAFRGTCYMVLKNLQLEDFGNTIPSFQVEVVRNDGSIELHEIIADICRESGLADGEFNVTCGMQEVSLHGFAITDRTSGRDAIQQLQQLFPFDATETAYTLRFAWTERRPQALMRREDFGAHVAGDQPPPSEELVRAQDYDMPRKLTLKYQEPTRNYSLNTAMAQRLITESNLEEEVTLAIAMDRDEAKSRIEGALAVRFQSRRTYKIILPRKYSILEPGDVVLVPDKDDATQQYALRLLDVSIGNNGLIEANFSDYHYQTRIDAITDNDIAVDDDIEDGVPQGSRTYAYMLDLPLLSDTEEDNVGFYTLLSGTRQGWNGGALLVDVGSGGEVLVFGVSNPVSASGATWVVAARNTDMVAHGFSLTKLGTAIPGVWDYANSITVRLLDTQAALFSYTQTDLLAKALNVAVVGDEIIQFANATDKGNGVWELDTLLRGQRGTEWAVAGHQKGDRFLILSADAVDRVTHTQSLLNVSTRYRALSFNDSPEDAEDFWFANSGNSLRPYSPYVRKAERQAGGSIRLEWLPRVRQNGGMLNGEETTLDQPFDRYEIDVMNGTTVVRTTAIDSVRAWDYPAATIASDFGSVADSITVRLYQIGKIVGRGFVKELVV